MFLKYIQLFRERWSEKMCTRVCPDIVALEPTFVAFLWHSQTYVQVVRALLSNFFEEQ